MNLENDATITSTGGEPTCPWPSGTATGGNHRSHWAESPGRWLSRSAGSFGAYSTRSRATFLRNHDGEPNQPTRSANTEAGIAGNSASSCRTCASNGSNADGPLTREYFGGELDLTARATVSRDSPNRAAIARIDRPSPPCRYLICAQSCTVITHPILVGWPIFKERQWPSFQRASTLRLIHSLGTAATPPIRSRPLR